MSVELPYLPFEIEPHTTADKVFAIFGPDVVLMVDYDDVDHETVDRQARKIVRILNANWDDLED